MQLYILKRGIRVCKAICFPLQDDFDESLCEQNISGQQITIILIINESQFLRTQHDI